MTAHSTLIERAEVVVADYRAGRSMASIAAELDCNPGSVWHFLNARGVVEPRRSPNYGDTDRFLPDIRSGLEAGKSAYRVAEDLGVGKHLVLRVMKRHGLSTAHKSTRREHPLGRHAEEIVTRYQAGESMLDLARAFQSSDVSILRILEQRGVCRRPRAKYAWDESFFDAVDTEVKAYVLGWFYSDGNNLKNGLGARLQITDLDILERIRQEMKYTGPIHTRPGRQAHHLPMHTLQINSPKLSSDLTRLGCPPAKTFLIRFPSQDLVPAHLVRHFARGYCDGDGSIGGPKWRIQVVGTRHLLDGLAAASGVVGHFSQRHPARDKDNWTWQVYRKAEFPKLADWLYRDSTIRLERKHAKYLEYCEAAGRAPGVLGGEDPR